MKFTNIHKRSLIIVPPLLSIFSLLVSSFGKEIVAEGEPGEAFDAGILINSTAGGGQTVIAGVGPFSHTITGGPCDEDDGLSATSNNNPACTNTHDAGIYTGYRTTITG